MSMVDAPRRLRACGFGRYPSSRAATITRSRVSAAIGTRVGASLRTRETVLWETPAARAISRIVVIDRGRVPSVPVTVADDGSLAPSCGSLPIAASVAPRCGQTISVRHPVGVDDETPGPGKGPSRGSENGTPVASDATLGHRMPVRLVEDDLAEVPDMVRLGRGRRMVVVELQERPLAVADLEEAHDLAPVVGVLARRRAMGDGSGDPLGHDGRLEVGGRAGLRQRQVGRVAE